MARRVYLDHSATTPLRPEVRSAMAPYEDEAFANPSSLHRDGQRAKRALDGARAAMADALGAAPAEILFTGGGTEGDNQALVGAVRAARGRGRHLITTAIEHHAVLNTCRWLETQGYAVTYLPVDAGGVVDLDALARSLREDTVLVSVMLANNEVGTVEPLAEVARLAHARGALVHTDAVQAVGKLPVRVDELGVDLLTLTAHKFGGPKGVGALYVRRGTPLEPLLYGGHQEGGLRAGTQNVPGIVGLAEALRLAVAELPQETARLAALRDRLEEGVLAVGDARVNGDRRVRLPNILNVGIAGVEGEALLLALDMQGVAVSTGSACSAGQEGASHVLEAMGVPPEYIRGSLRFSLGHTTTAEEIEVAIDAVARVVERLRALAPAGEARGR
jgi:cysteine desulfurase